MREKISPLDRAPLPPLNALRAFETAARHGNFARAAAELNVTHWAIGKQIRLLEDWLGVPLFERQARGVVLTDEGKDLFTDVNTALARLSAAAQRLGRARSTPRVFGTVKINVPTSFALHWLMPRLPEFAALFPDIDVRISTTSRKLRYVGSAFDFGIRLNRSLGAGLAFRTLMKDWQLPACSPAALSAEPIQEISDLRRHTLLHSATTRRAWPSWLAAAAHPDLAAARQLEFEHVHLQLQAAIDGLGIAMASLPLIERHIAAGRLVCPVTRPLLDSGDYLLVSDNRSESTAARAFRGWIMAAAKPPMRARDATSGRRGHA